MFYDEDQDKDSLPPLEILDSVPHREYLASARSGKRNPESLKHRTQQAGIIAHLQQLGAFHSLSASSTIIEFGAGSGFLSSALRIGYPIETNHSTFYLIDRDTPPLRRGDKYIAGKKNGSSTTTCVRIKCDLSNLCLDGLLQDESVGKDRTVAKEEEEEKEDVEKKEKKKSCPICMETLPELDIKSVRVTGEQKTQCKKCCNKDHTFNRPVIGLGKHLCGQATDFSLRCFVSRGNYLTLAPCCYHRCTFDTLCGTEFLEKVGVTREIFQLAARLSPMGHNVEDIVDGKYSKRRERARVYGSTVVDIFIPPSSFQPISLAVSRISSILKQPKQFFFLTQ